jgi:hypothetical protein
MGNNPARLQPRPDAEAIPSWRLCPLPAGVWPGSLQQGRNGKRWRATTCTPSGHTTDTGSKKAARSGDHEKAIETIRPVQWAHLDSNQGQPGYEPGALTAELWALQKRAKQLTQIQ